MNIMSAPYEIRVTAARAEARGAAESAGITPALISELVDTFYGRIRAHPELGPVFEQALADRWDPHLETMKQFWSAVIFHDGGYSGRPVPAHMKLDGLTPGLFTQWLDLFSQTLLDIEASETAAAHFTERAELIARSLQLNIFYNPSAQGQR